MRAGLLTVGLGALLGGCADLRDLFRPYAPHPEEVEALLAAPAPQPRYDAALVLGCPANPDGSLSLCQRCRVDAAVASWHAGQVKTLIMSGGAAHSPEVEAEVMARAARARGLPEKALLREPEALTTWQNIYFSKKLLDARGWRTVLVISTADHLPRARRIARFWGLDDDTTGYQACDRGREPPPSDAADTR